jgi:hypothetical protein
MPAVALLLLSLAAMAQTPAPDTRAPDQTPTPPASAWLARPVANLIELDKIAARPARVSVRVGQSASFGTLSIAVRACMVRPPDQPADATAFLDITDSRTGGVVFHGWIILSDPALSMLQHPVYDVRLAGCAG